MSDQATQPATDTRLADLKAKMKGREGKPGYGPNVQALKDEIARLEREK